MNSHPMSWPLLRSIIAQLSCQGWGLDASCTIRASHWRRFSSSQEAKCMKRMTAGSDTIALSASQSLRAKSRRISRSVSRVGIYSHTFFRRVARSDDIGRSWHSTVFGGAPRRGPTIKDVYRIAKPGWEWMDQDVDFPLTERQRHLLDVAVPLAERFVERAGKHDGEASFPFENVADLRAAGMLALTVPVEYGG